MEVVGRIRPRTTEQCPRIVVPSSDLYLYKAINHRLHFPGPNHNPSGAYGANAHRTRRYNINKRWISLLRRSRKRQQRQAQT
jgi:hypothetical protein